MLADYPATVILDALANAFWPFIRISALLMTMLVFGTQFVTPRLRILLSILLTMLLLPVLPEMPKDVALLSLTGFWITIQQVLIGLAMGLVTQFMIQSFVVLGQIIAMQSSLGFASMVDPANGQQTPVLGQWFLFLFLLVFLSTDGHLQILRMVALSFQTLPVGILGLTPLDYYSLSQWLGHIFSASVSMALAAMIALLLVNISFGFMSRVAPQLNVFSLGFSVILVLGLWISSEIISGIMPWYDRLFQLGQGSLCALIRCESS